MRKKLLNFLCCTAALLTLASCGSAAVNQPAYKEKSAENNLQELKEENGDYEMALNTVNYGITLTKLSTGEKWGTTPVSDGEPQFDELGMPVTNHPQVESALRLVYRNAESRTDDVLLSFTDSVSEGTVNAYKTENGFTVEYYFKSAEIAVPVRYELTNGGVRISVDPTKIAENKNRVVKVGLAPFFASAKNDGEGCYLFVPSGSGAIINAETVSETGNTGSEQVYGDDGAIDREIISTNKKEIRLPVFGAKNGNTASLAIIENGAESAFITFNKGAAQYGYSTVYADFQVRGYTNHTAKFFAAGDEKLLLYSKPMITGEISVLYLPLSGKEADYSGMARAYRDYLNEKYGEKSVESEKALNLTVSGGKMITRSFLGIPYKSLYALTTVSDAAEITESLSKKTGGDFQVKLTGYGETGTDIGAPGGGFKLNKSLGSEKELKNFISDSKTAGIDVYMNYDLVRFNKSSGGFFVRRDAVYNVGELKAVQYFYDIAAKSKLKDTAHYLLSPSGFGKAAEKLIKSADKLGLDAVSLDTLSSMSYSDYRNKKSTEYYSKSGMTDKAAGVFRQVAESGRKLMGTDANLYAAVLSDAVAEIPVCSSEDYSFSYDIPFYSMVFKGRVPLYCESINLCPQTEEAFLHAIEGGTGIGYTVSAGWDKALLNSENEYFYNRVYSELENDITDYTLKISDYLKKINGAPVKSHRVLDNGLRETVFENGVTAYVNYADKSLSSPAGEVGAHDYLVLEKLP